MQNQIIFKDNSKKKETMSKLELIKNTESKKNLSRGTKELIRKAIIETKSFDRHVLCYAISQMCEEKYGGYKLDYQLTRMNIETTGKILNAIDIFLTHYGSSIVFDNVDEKSQENEE